MQTWSLFCSVFFFVVVFFLILHQASRAQILDKATEYIQYMRRKNHTHQQDIDDLKRQNALLEQQGEQPSSWGNWPCCAPPGGGFHTWASVKARGLCLRSKLSLALQALQLSVRASSEETEELGIGHPKACIFSGLTSPFLGAQVLCLQ
jgi:hypothetical protein